LSFRIIPFATIAEPAMPIYEYRCAACGHELEALQKLTDSPLKDCPACGRKQLSKLVSAAGFRLKGSGWYATDFKNTSKPAQKSNGGDGKAEPTAATADGAAAKPAAGESKPEAAPAAAASKPETTPASGS
jgi:putative FmdB family regulatory protein